MPSSGSGPEMNLVSVKKLMPGPAWLRCCAAPVLIACLIATAAIGMERENRAGMAPGGLHMREPSRLVESGDWRDFRWLCYYGANREVLDLPGYGLMVLEADALGPLTEKNEGAGPRIAYMSIGEVSQSRWFWPFVENKPWLLDPDPSWPGARRVDPRSDEWSDLLVNTVAPRLLAAGYDGLMLDNVDMGEYLESRDPQKFAGAREAVVNIIRRLRQTYPEAVIVANGALETAADTADSLDAVVCESFFSRWRIAKGGTTIYEPVPPEDQAWLKPGLARLQAVGLPILTLDYVGPGARVARQRIMDAAKKAGYFPYIGERTLMSFPRLNSAATPNG